MLMIAFYDSARLIRALSEKLVGDAVLVWAVHFHKNTSTPALQQY